MRRLLNVQACHQQLLSDIKKQARTLTLTLTHTYYHTPTFIPDLVRLKPSAVL